MRRLIFAAALLLAPWGALADPSPSLSLTSQPTCTSTPSLLVAAQPGQLHVFTVEQLSTTQFEIGNANVTTTTGFVIPNTQYSSYTISFSGPVYCVTSSGAATTSVIETVKGG